MPSPQGRIFSGAVFLDPCIVQHCLDAAADPGRSFRYFLPDWLQNGQHGVCVDHIDRHCHDHAGVLRERARPLRTMFGIFPARLFGCDQLLGRLPECHG